MGMGVSFSVCTRRVRAVAVVVQHGVSKPEQEEEDPCMRRGQK